MKILYLVDFDLNSSSGILNKIVQQTSIWTKNGHQVQVLSTKPSRNQKNIDFQGVIRKSYYSNKKNSSLNNYLFKVRSSSIINKDIRRYHPDVIYYRQGIWYPGLTKVLKLYQVVMEVNTNDLIEIQNETIARRIIYKFGRTKILNHINGLVTVTTELNELYSHKNVPKVTIGNGYLFDTNEIEKNRISDRPQLVFVGSPNCQWHGVDKIYYMAKKIPEFDFHIIGIKQESNLNNVKFYGYLALDEIKKIYSFCDVAIGSLSLYKAGVNESSTLKVREYLCNALPIILGGYDVDMKGSDYILELPNSTNNVKDNISTIKEFVLYWTGKNIDRTNIIRKLSYETKEKERLVFLSKFLNENT
ncbi:hypothetical protein [Aquimarina litoralis]|uniref:hypothetical protein n=1 Tax=Aquimarina litoralis TaxID=584605 RepID=UPI001C58FE7F|nr:hypothetical protein [Aquimarina litoralis]MBW1293910.1 hypothetical protein [Aquimarina litoralis]